MQKIENLKEIIAEIEIQEQLFRSKENLRAAVRCRKLLNDLKVLAQDIRLEILKEKQGLSTLRYNKSRRND